MSEMTTAGKTLRLYDSRQEIVVALGDRVRLRNGWTGMALTWTERGVAVLLDPGIRPFVAHLYVAAVAAGDGDIAVILPDEPEPEPKNQPTEPA
jgi:hypothetical protein